MAKGERVAQWLARFEMDEPLRTILPLEVRFNPGEGAINWLMSTVCCDSGMQDKFWLCSVLPDDVETWDDDRFYTWLRSELIRFLVHELDESLYVDGAKRWDPHRGETRE